MRRWWLLITGWLRLGGAREAELERELRDHLELEAEARLADGLPPDAAWRAARRDLGNVTRIRETVHDMHPLARIEPWMKDARHAARSLWRQPAFTLFATASLALGIGSNAAVFTIADQALLRLLPVERPQELVLLRWDGEFIGGSSRGGGSSTAVPAGLATRLRIPPISISATAIRACWLGLRRGARNR